MKMKERPTINVVPAITVACAALALFCTAFEFGYEQTTGLFIRLSPDFFAGGFVLVLRLIALSVPLSMMLMGVFIRKADARLMMLSPVLNLVYGADVLLYYIRADLLEGQRAVVWAVCQALVPLVFAVILFLTLNGKLQKPFGAAFAGVAALLITVGVRIAVAVLAREFVSVLVPEALFYLGLTAFVTVLDFPAVERAAQYRVFAGTPDQFCPEWEDGDIPEELCEYEDITSCVLISVFTLGLYQLVWLYRLCKKIRLLAGESKKCKKEIVMIALVPFYILYWMYSRGGKISEHAKKLNIHLSNNGLFYMLFSLCGLSVFAVAMMQKDFNRISRRLDQTVSAAALQSEIDRKEKLEKGETAAPQKKDAAEEKIDTVSLLQALKQLRAMGILTEEEYKDKKQQVLNQF